MHEVLVNRIGLFQQSLPRWGGGGGGGGGVGGDGILKRMSMVSASKVGWWSCKNQF